jgi:L-2-hydroxyglutarate oxidase
VPETGIIDYKAVARKYFELFEMKGGTLMLNHKVLSIKQLPQNNIVNTNQGEISAKLIVNCAGLYSDKMAALTIPNHDIKIIPFRGEYYELKKEKEYLVKNLIYPVPNPDFPFLGVHFTRMIQGGIEAGPNAVLAFRKEGYNRWDINVKELFETLTFSGFQKVASKYWDEGWAEMKRSFSKKLFVKAMQELIPEIQYKDVERSGAGVRAQACDKTGGLLDDFSIVETESVINVCNAPSPAATASLAIGETIAIKILKKF